MVMITFLEFVFYSLSCSVAMFTLIAMHYEELIFISFCPFNQNSTPLSRCFLFLKPCCEAALADISYYFHLFNRIVHASKLIYIL